MRRRIPIGLVTIVGVACMLTACHPPTPRAANVEVSPYATAFMAHGSYTATAFISVMTHQQQTPLLSSPLSNV